ncbi:hypothetical protein AXG93_93s1410 [Marchantia polymorpha subsp. ruderalis]|uniref:Uncharacterized protein n=1 Tax=Marchantia polymorpha subsp. ruderalis TaxID=1480154 RepID=A0A176WUN8_MARPO|nr:hypothetical protein AXG93_93s1410 [Marchantia polymorpha subsp. ruderalis]
MNESSSGGEEEEEEAECIYLSTWGAYEEFSRPGLRIVVRPIKVSIKFVPFRLDDDNHATAYEPDHSRAYGMYLIAVLIRSLPLDSSRERTHNHEVGAIQSSDQSADMSLWSAVNKSQLRGRIILALDTGGYVLPWEGGREIEGEALGSGSQSLSSKACGGTWREELFLRQLELADLDLAIMLELFAGKIVDGAMQAGQLKPWPVSEAIRNGETAKALSADILLEAQDPWLASWAGAIVML